jgi:hypothetical protein
MFSAQKHIAEEFMAHGVHMAMEDIQFSVYTYKGRLNQKL